MRARWLPWLPWLLLAATLACRAADLNIALAADVSSLDPHYLNVASNNAIATHFFGTLVEVDADGHLTPGLAQSWQAIDATTWEFKMRGDVRFSDGTPLTIDDVMFSLDRPATITNSPGPFTSFTKIIQRKEATDAHTLRLVTVRPYAALPLNLASVFIVSKRAATHATTEDFNSGKALIGTGPYRLVRYRRGEAIEMTRNDYDTRHGSAWRNVTFRILPNDATRLASLLSGQSDVIEAVPAADMRHLLRDARFRIEQRTSWRALFLQLGQQNDASPDLRARDGKPLARNPLRDRRVRLALAKAIDRQALAAYTLEGMGVPADDLVAPGIFGHHDAAQMFDYDPADAKRLLADAGYADGFAVTLHGPNNRYINDDQVLHTVAQFFARVGIDAHVETLPLNLYFGKLRSGAYGIGLLGWGSLANDLALRSIVCSPDAQGGGTWNWTGYHNTDVDALVGAALAETDQDKRAALARRAAAQASDDVAYIPLHYQIVSWAMKKNLRYAPRVDEFTFAWQFAEAAP